jgi:peptidyl-prolyl cis-trans isomerase B (cyclophilin B)
VRRSLVALCLAALVAGCGGGGNSSSSSDQTSSNGAALPKTFGGCTRVAQPNPKQVEKTAKPKTTLPAGRTYTVDLDTTCGKISIRLDTARAPKTTASFASLVRRGFYDDLTFHRVSNPNGRPFVIQGGDPLGTGTGGPGYTVVERPPRNLKYTRGVVAMAKSPSQPRGASGSQFFIVTAPSAPLPPDYALVGKVVGGDDVVTKIQKLPTEPQSESPLRPVVIRKATLRTN